MIDKTGASALLPNQFDTQNIRDIESSSTLSSQVSRTKLWINKVVTKVIDTICIVGLLAGVGYSVYLAATYNGSDARDIKPTPQGMGLPASNPTPRAN